MRSRVFRVLAGLLAVLFAWFLATADHSGRPTRELVGFWVVGLAFGTFALFGTAPAEQLLCLVFGSECPERPPVGHQAGDDKRA